MDETVQMLIILGSLLPTFGRHQVVISLNVAICVTGSLVFAVFVIFRCSRIFLADNP